MRIRLNAEGTAYARVGLPILEALEYLADVRGAEWAGRSVEVVYIDAQPRLRQNPRRWIHWVWQCTVIRARLIGPRLRALVPGARRRVRNEYFYQLLEWNKDQLNA